MERHQYDHDIVAIILRSAYTTLNAEEQEKLLQYLNASEANRTKYQELIQEENLRLRIAQYANRNEHRAENFQTLLQALHTKPAKTPLYRLLKYTSVAAVGLFLLAGAWFFLNKPRPHKKATSNKTALAAIVPGSTGAVLTLADGSTVVLDSLSNGVIAAQPGANVLLNNGQLAYDKNAGVDGALRYNTLATPRGRKFQVQLPDGSQVWLNSGSSIRYPVQFNNKLREVYITGEVYFEVAPKQQPHSKNKLPFVVHVQSPTGEAGRVEVLGTHFNINAYTPIAITTLLEGAVRVNTQLASPAVRPVVLQPGQQAKVATGKGAITTAPANTDQVMAWRRGFFNFDDAGIEEVMQQLARWYDLDVVYQGAVPAIRFEGELSRQMKLSGVLTALEDSKVHFKIEGRRIVIQP